MVVSSFFIAFSAICTAILLQLVYNFAKENNMTLSEALDFFYKSNKYKLISQGVGCLHCLSNAYLAENLAHMLNIPTAQESIMTMMNKKTSNSVWITITDDNPF